MVEVKFWEFNNLVEQVVHYLMLRTCELQNFRNYRVINGYRDAVQRTHDLEPRYDGWNWAIVRWLVEPDDFNP